MKEANIGRVVYWIGYRIGKREASKSLVSYDCVAQMEAQDIADTVFQDNFQDNFMLGYERGYNFQVSNNTESEKSRLRYIERMKSVSSEEYYNK